MPPAPSSKRRRVAQACQRCRLLKSKVCISTFRCRSSSQKPSDLVSYQCDGQHPVCSPCQCYGHTCIWPENVNRSRSTDSSQLHRSSIGKSEELRPTSSLENSAQLLQAIQSYEKLLSSIRHSLDDSSRAAVDLTLSYIRHHLPEDVTGAMASESSSAAATVPPSSTSNVPGERTSKRRRYLGEASDVHFFHVVKQVLGNKQPLENTTENDMQSYDQEEFPFQSPSSHGARLHLPSKEIADKYIEIYFCTIHIAYPFIYKPSFIVRYENFWKGDFEVEKRSSWLPLLCKSFPYSK
jgi:hypothetical protein